MLAIIVFLLAPDSVVNLDRVHNAIEIYGNKVYLTAFADNSIDIMASPETLQTITITDDLNYRISSLAITPFFFYLNSGRTIEKFYLSSGTKETVFESKNISSFIVIDNEELIISDYSRRELIFLDFLYNRRLVVSDINIQDICHSNDLIYTLTNNTVHLFDEHGNIHSTLRIPDASTHITVQDSTIFLCHKGKNRIYIRNEKTWRIMELQSSIRDIAILGNLLVILAENGSSLHFYDLSHFTE